MGRVAVVLGTRPEIIKLADVVAYLGTDARVVHTGQHYDAGMSQVFLDGLQLPAPVSWLRLGGLPRSGQIGRGIEQLGTLLADLRPDAVVVQGDTNSALAGALAANATGLPLIHVESGLRSFDRAMPEEHNRVLVDHLADLLAAPTETAVGNLAREGITGERVICCGNTVIEAVHRQLPDPAHRAELLRRLELAPARYVLATVHRPENTDDPEVLAAVLTGLGRIPMPVVLSLHPRTAHAARRFGLDGLLARLRTVAPLGGADFLALAAEAALLVSDSGGIQEEVTVLARPLVVVRRSTERPEAFEDFATLVAPAQIESAARAYLDDIAAVHRRLAALPSPFGDGSASARIVAELRRRFLTSTGS